MTAWGVCSTSPSCSKLRNVSVCIRWEMLGMLCIRALNRIGPTRKVPHDRHGPLVPDPVNDLGEGATALGRVVVWPVER